MKILICLFYAFLGLILGSFFNRIGNVLSNDKNYKYSICDSCKYKIKLFHISTFSYIFNLGRCENCHKKISIFPVIIELLTSILFLCCYLFFNKDPKILYMIYSLSFISSLIIIMVSDIKYMIISDKVLIFFIILMIILKLLIAYNNEDIKDLLDIGYSLIFLIYDGLFMFFVMYIIKILGDYIVKKDSMGGGDIKLMFYISLVLGWKLSIVVVFLAAFFALPASIYYMLRKKSIMLAFGPYLAFSSILLFLLNVDFNTLLNYIK